MPHPSPYPTDTLRLAALQCALNGTVPANVERLTQLVRQAADAKAQVVCLPELFEGPYFCCNQTDKDFLRAHPFAGHATLAHFQHLAKEHALVLVLPFFEQDGPHYYNSTAVVDADGQFLKNDRGHFVYRKSHIPQGPGYEEKYYFRPGNTGFTTWSSRYVKLGVGICWDQWYPEAARAMALRGAEVLLYPTAIGSEPTAPELDTQPEWQLAMRGHALCNKVAVVAANRIGQETAQTFYGSSFVANCRGEIIAELGRTQEGMAIAEISLSEMRTERDLWGFFRDRRTDLYQDLITP